MDDLLSKVRWISVRLGCGVAVGIVLLALALLMSYT